MSALDEARRAKDRFFGEDPHSPLTIEQRREFQGLAYYDEDPALRLQLTPEPFDQPELIEMQTSTGESATYLRWAKVRFEVGGQAAELTLYRSPGSDAIFLPFQDANAGGETYGAGRYLDVDLEEDGTVLLDFNEAYNPYCAYNDMWSCPLPPAENRLRVAIRAGEKSYREEWRLRPRLDARSRFGADRGERRFRDEIGEVGNACLDVVEGGVDAGDVVAGGCLFDEGGREAFGLRGDGLAGTRSIEAVTAEHALELGEPDVLSHREGRPAG